MADASAIVAQRSTIQNTGVVTTGGHSGTVLASNNTRGAFTIQNLDASNPLLICLGGTASSSNYTQILQAGSGTADGKGGFMAMEAGVVYTGIITYYSASTNATFVYMEI